MIIAIIVKFSQGDIMVNLFSVFGAGPGVVGTFKIVQCIRYRKPLKKAMDLLDVMMSEVDELVMEPIVRKGMERCWIAFVLCLFFGSCISIHWLSRPLLILLFYGERTRIIDTWPVFNDNWFQWSLTFVFQASNVCFCGHTFYIFDNVYFCISESLLCQLKVLKYRLTHLKLDGSVGSNAALEICIKQHTQVLKVCDLLKFSSEGVIMFQCINTVIMLCTGIFILTLVEHINFNVLLNLGEITLVIIIILFFYCWYSNEIAFQCSELATYAYMMDWTEGTSDQKKKLLNMMTMPMQPVIFGGIVEMNLNTFINVLKTAFSYYNFLVAANAGGDHGK
ncbi:unnamed protein product [Nezara viridula]|uniref:Odorant receptor n=1 Tax=Nezara viridula TaxID=85310 RepID=A0A9P0HNQ3_NEZVI|nr:unnamed protein product [Nezara viridula]